MSDVGRPSVQTLIAEQSRPVERWLEQALAPLLPVAAGPELLELVEGDE